MPNPNGDVEFNIKEHIGVIDVRDNGWTKEVNIVEWNGGDPKIDIREWEPGHRRMSRGITLTEEQAEKMTKALAQRYGVRAEHNLSAPARDAYER